MLCGEALPLAQTVHSGPLSRWAWNFTQNHALLCRLWSRWIESFLASLFLTWALTGSLFSKSVLRFNILRDQIQDPFTCEQSVIRKQNFLHGEFGHPFWFFVNRKDVGWESLCKKCLCVRHDWKIENIVVQQLEFKSKWRFSENVGNLELKGLGVNPLTALY